MVVAHSYKIIKPKMVFFGNSPLYITLNTKIAEIFVVASGDHLAPVVKPEKQNSKKGFLGHPNGHCFNNSCFTLLTKSS